MGDFLVCVKVVKLKDAHAIFGPFFLINVVVLELTQISINPIT